MRKTTSPSPASKKSGAHQSQDVHAAASQPADRKLPIAQYTPAGSTGYATSLQALILGSIAPPLALEREDLCRDSYCRPYMAMHPLALCVPQSAPACVGTKIWFVNWLTVMLWELEPVVTLTSH
jgi:hypothetical protein